VPMATREAHTLAPVARNYPEGRREVSVVPLAKRQLMA